MAAPASARRRAMPRPIPPEAPVTSATLPERSRRSVTAGAAVGTVEIPNRPLLYPIVPQDLKRSGPSAGAFPRLRAQPIRHFFQGHHACGHRRRTRLVSCPPNWGHCMAASPRPRRSALYIPGSNPRALDKGRSIAADVLILDLEDAVDVHAKETARVAVAAAISVRAYG